MAALSADSTSPPASVRQAAPRRPYDPPAARREAGSRIFRATVPPVRKWYFAYSASLVPDEMQIPRVGLRQWWPAPGCRFPSASCVGHRVRRCRRCIHLPDEVIFRRGGIVAAINLTAHAATSPICVAVTAGNKPGMHWFLCLHFHAVMPTLIAGIRFVGGARKEAALRRALKN